MRMLPPCRLRRAIVRVHAVSGWAAISRRDYDLTFVRYMHDVVYESTAGFRRLACRRGFRVVSDAAGLVE